MITIEVFTQEGQFVDAIPTNENNINEVVNDFENRGYVVQVNTNEVDSSVGLYLTEDS